MTIGTIEKVWTTLTNRTILTTLTDQQIYQYKCRIRIVYLVLFLTYFTTGLKYTCFI